MLFVCRSQSARVRGVVVCKKGDIALIAVLEDLKKHSKGVLNEEIARAYNLASLSAALGTTVHSRSSLHEPTYNDVRPYQTGYHKTKEGHSPHT